MILLWPTATVIAAALQTGRNALQSGLVKEIGTVGATQVRFLFGLPFAVMFLILILAYTGQDLPNLNAQTLGYVTLGALAQIIATALMLVVMKNNNFAISTAWLKGEPVIVALIGWLVLGEVMPPLALVGIGISVFGVLVLSLKPGAGKDLAQFRPATLGLLAGGLFAFSGIGFRGAIVSLDSGDSLLRAVLILAITLGLQTTVLLVWMACFDRQAIRASLKAWCPSISAGGIGATASLFWFLGFALTTAANVRTLALIEVIFALMVARWYFGQKVSPRQLLGIGLLIFGIGVLLSQTL